LELAERNLVIVDMFSEAPSPRHNDRRATELAGGHDGRRPAVTYNHRCRSETLLHLVFWDIPREPRRSWFWRCPDLSKNAERWKSLCEAVCVPDEARERVVIRSHGYKNTALMTVKSAARQVVQ
jgi:hypothetical protein